MGTLYDNIIHLCEVRGIKGGKMCVDLGISKSLLSDLKAGRKKSIRIDTAEKIANYFGVQVGDLLRVSDIEQAESLSNEDFLARYKKLPFGARFQIENIVDWSAQHPDTAPEVLESVVYDLPAKENEIKRKKSPPVEDVDFLNGFAAVAHNYSGKLRPQDEETLIRMIKIFAKDAEESEEVDGQVGGDIR